MAKHYPLHPGQIHAEPYYCTIPLEEYESMKKRIVQLEKDNAALELANKNLAESVAKLNEMKSKEYELDMRERELKEERRRRKFSEEKPDDKCVVLVHGDEWFETAIYHDDGTIDFGDDIHFSDITEAPYWMPLPSAPEEASNEEIEGNAALREA